MQSILTNRVLSLIVIAIVVGCCISFPAIRFKRGKGHVQVVKYVEGIGNMVTERHPWEPEFQTPTLTELMYRSAICLTLLVSFVLLRRHRERQYERGFKKYKDGDLMLIKGEPIQGELMMPVKLLGDSSNHSGSDTSFADEVPPASL